MDAKADDGHIYNAAEDYVCSQLSRFSGGSAGGSSQVPRAIVRQRKYSSTDEIDLPFYQRCHGPCSFSFVKRGYHQTYSHYEAFRPDTGLSEERASKVTVKYRLCLRRRHQADQTGCLCRE